MGRSNSGLKYQMCEKFLFPFSFPRWKGRGGVCGLAEGVPHLKTPASGGGVMESHASSCGLQRAAQAAATGLTLPPQLDTLQPLWAHLGKPSHGSWSPPAPEAWHLTTGSPPRGSAPCCPEWLVIVANLDS